MIITRLEEFILKSGDDGRNKGRLGFHHEYHQSHHSYHQISMIIIMITRLEDFILQSCDNSRNKGRLGVGKEWDGRDQCTTVEVDHVLKMNLRDIQ